MARRYLYDRITWAEFRARLAALPAPLEPDQFCLLTGYDKETLRRWRLYDEGRESGLPIPQNAIALLVLMEHHPSNVTALYKAAKQMVYEDREKPSVAYPFRKATVERIR